MKARSLNSHLEELNYKSDPKGLEFFELLTYVQAGPNDGYFHSKDKSYWSFFQVSGIDDTLLGDGDKNLISVKLNKCIINLIPGSGMSYTRFINTNISQKLKKLTASTKNDIGAKMIADSLHDHQINAANSDKGFQYNVKESEIQKAIENDEKELLKQVGAKGAEFDKDITRGYKPTSTTHIVGIRWTPANIGSDEILAEVRDKILAAMGVVSNDKLSKEKYLTYSKNFISNKRSFMARLKDTGLAVRELNGQDIVNLLYKQMNPVRSKKIGAPEFKAGTSFREILNFNLKDIGDAKDNLRSNVFNSRVTIKPEGLDIHTPNDKDYYYRTVTCKNIKSGKRPDFISNEYMKGIEGEGIISMHAEISDSAMLLSQLNILISQKETQKFVMSNRLLKIFSNQEQYDNEIATLKYIKRTTSSKSEEIKQSVTDITFAYTAGGHDLDEIHNRLSLAQQQFDKNGIIEDHNGSAVIHHLSLGNYRKTASKKLDKIYPTLSGDYAMMLPIYVSFMGANSDAILVNNRDGEIIYIDLFNTKDTKTGHSLVVGGTGTGKSFTFIYLFMGIARKYKLRAWIIDKGGENGGSFGRPIEALGGEYQVLNTGKLANQPLTCLNPLAMVRGSTDIDNQATNLTDTLDVFSNVLDNKSLTSADRHIAYSAAQKFFKDLDPNTEGRLEQYFNEYLRKENNSESSGEKIADRLNGVYGDGQFSKLFDGRSTLQWSTEIIGFDIASVDEKVLPVIMHLLFAIISDYCIFHLPKDVCKLIVIDEAWKALSAKGIVSKVSSYYRELRKFNGACVLISQTITEFIKLIDNDDQEDGDGILPNTNHFFLMAAADDDYREAKARLGFTDREVNAWKSLKSAVPYYAEVFYRRRRVDDRYYSGVFRIYSPPFLYWLATTNPHETHAVETEQKKLIKAGESKQIASMLASKKLSEIHAYGM